MRLMLAALAVVVTATPALAGPGEYRGRVEPYVEASVSREQAAAIAFEQGVFDIHQIRLRSGVWRVEGQTNNNQNIEVEIDAQSGAVLKREIA